MRRFKFICLLFASALLVNTAMHAQETDKSVSNEHKKLKPKEDEPSPFDKRTFSIGIGFNSVPQFSHYLSGSRAYSSFYTLNINKRLQLGSNEVMRFGLNLDIHPTTDYKFYFSGYYIGVERSYFLKKPYMRAYAGADFLIQQRVEFVDILTKTQNRFGIAPLAGLEWRPLPWLSFTTDASYAFSFRQTLIQHETSAKTDLVSNKFDFNVNAVRLISFSTNFHF